MKAFAACCLYFSITISLSAEEPLIKSIEKVTLRKNRDGASLTWFHPRACLVPQKKGPPVALMNLQEIGGSDYFGQVHWSESRDVGKTWTDPEPIAALGRDPMPDHDGFGPPQTRPDRRPGKKSLNKQIPINSISVSQLALISKPSHPSWIPPGSVGSTTV